MPLLALASPSRPAEPAALSPPRPSRCYASPEECPGAAAVATGGTPVTERFAFRVNDYYAALVDWDDPGDPLRKLVAPARDELREFGSLDASNEAANTPLVGLQHKYRDTAVLLVTDECFCFCRYCFRKRLFLPGSREAQRDYSGALEYIATHPEITDVLLTGGDPLTLPTSRLEEIMTQLVALPHVRTLRIGTKALAFNPYRVLDDADLGRLVSDLVAQGCTIHVMTHFDHPRELTSAAAAAVAMLRAAGAVCLNQCPVTAGINDDPDVLAELFQRCTEVGCPQYYIFQCRPTVGTSHFVLPIVRVAAVVDGARARVSGLSRRARLCLSHASGKVEVVGVDARCVYARYHRARRPEDEGRFLTYQRDDEARWLDELVSAVNV